MGLVETSVTTTAASRESTAYVHGSAYSERESTIASTPSAEVFFTMARGRLWSDVASLNHVWDSVSNLRKGVYELLYNPEANRLTQVRDIAAPNTVRHTYAYDAAGFVTTRDGVALGYDATGAIATIGSVAAFDHDLNGRPVSRTLNGTTKLFRFGGAIAYTTSGSPIEMDLGEVVIKLDGSTNRYRHMDFRGNVLFVTNGETVEGQASYRGFGRESASGNLGERGFAQGFEVSSLGLVVLGPRVLDSDAGRFLSQDPVFNTVNLYAYAQGNPVLMWDPSGRHPVGALVSLDLSGFTFTLDISGLTVGGPPGNPPGPPPGRDPGDTRIADGWRVALGAMVIGAGAETIDAGAAVVAASRGLPGPARAVGTIAGAGVMALGAAEVAVGTLIGSGALGAAGAQTTGADGSAGAK